MRNWCASTNHGRVPLIDEQQRLKTRNSCDQTGWAMTCGSIGSNQRSSPPCKALYSTGCQCARCAACVTTSPSTTKQAWRRRR
jgi:hypothetical protein